MGCPCSHEEEPPLINNKQDQAPYDRPYSGGLKMCQLNIGRDSPFGSRMASTDSAKDLNIVYTDLIGQGSGRLKDNYQIEGGPVGEGAYGQVRKATHKKTGVERAIKIISKKKCDKKAQEWLINEVAILKQLDHPNIMKVHEFFEDHKYFYIVTDFYDGGELFDKISSMKFFTEKFAASTIKQILSAIAYCHKHKIVHRDLKPENILYESKKTGAGIKVIDFGTSNLYDPKTVMNERFGTPYYIAPEVLNGNYTEKCDMWSIGVILYVLLCGFPPFDGDNEKEIFSKVLKGEYTFEDAEWKSVSEEAKDLIRKMLEMDIEKRISAEEALKDPWFELVMEEGAFDQPLAAGVLQNLMNFRTAEKLQSATWMFLVNHLASNEDKAQLLKTFKALDKDGDGTLSREELIEGYRTILNSENPEEDVDAIMRTVDNNNSGVIDYTEFVMATINRKNMLKKEKLEKAFAYFDKNGDGYLSAEEIAEVFNPGGQREVNIEVWRELIREFDTSGDGQISMAEFKEMMAKLL